MTTLATLERKLERLQSAPMFQPRFHVFVVEEGADITPDQRRQIRPSDQVVIRFYPRGLLGNI